MIILKIGNKDKSNNNNGYIQQCNEETVHGISESNHNENFLNPPYIARMTNLLTEKSVL